MIESGIMAVENSISTKDSNILVLGTRATIGSNLYHNGLVANGFKNIISIATPLFVPLVEEGIFDGSILTETMKLYFQDIKNIDVVILGCTHFPLIENKISEFLNGAKTIHSGDAIVTFLLQEYNLNINNHYDTKITFFATSSPDSLKEVAHKWLNI